MTLNVNFFYIAYTLHTHNYNYNNNNFLFLVHLITYQSTFSTHFSIKNKDEFAIFSLFFSTHNFLFSFNKTIIIIIIIKIFYLETQYKSRQ